MSDAVDRAIRMLVAALRDEIANTNRPGARSGADDEWEDLGPYPAPARPSGAVYFVRCSVGRLVKIGKASDLGARLSQLRNGCPFDLKLVAWFWTDDPTRVEAMLHSAFAEDRDRGEWFRPSERMDELIRAIANERKDHVARAITSLTDVESSFEWRGKVRPA